MGYLGQKTIETRNILNLILRQVTAHIELDSALMSKAEIGKRKLNREQIIKNVLLLFVTDDEFVSPWLCGKVIGASWREPLGEHGIKKAITKIKN
jgi:hypothetical protein